MAGRGVSVFLALAPLISQGFRTKTRSNGWNTSACGAAPSASDGPQPICTSYQSKLFEGERFWIRGFKSAPATAYKGCYIFLYGSQNDFTPGQAHEPQLYAPFFTREMANAGYCAVQVDYGRNTVSRFPLLPYQVTEKAEDIFGAQSSSALSVVHRITGCDCSRRTVVHGHSQGGMLASMAGRFSPSVDKILLFAGGCHAGIINVCTEVNRHKQLGVPSDADVSSDMRPQIRVVGTQDDGVLGCGVLDPAPTSASQYQTMSGRNCGGSTKCSGDVTETCVDAKGTGYIVVPVAKMPARAPMPHNWFMQSDPINEETESLDIWSKTYNVQRILYGNGSTFDYGYDKANLVNDDFKNTKEEYGWPAAKRFLLS